MISKANLTKLDEAIVDQIDISVSKGLFVSISEATRDAMRELVAKRCISVSHFLRVYAINSSSI
ncbi:MAG: ribbon-helix-helix domain-containing protein [Candidatus Methylarchaceae archaeon HK02M1]|nr:ribbon-helix-helix domain-containing protein [Candidatus Methylarchaceae archaeon HK02M1]